MGLLDGKAIIVTGAGRGLGSAFSLALAATGARVVVNDVNLDGKWGDPHPEPTGAAGGKTSSSYTPSLPQTGGSQHAVRRVALRTRQIRTGSMLESPHPIR